MSDRGKDGGSAFPHNDDGFGSGPGMSLRDYFAGQALAAMTNPMIVGSPAKTAERVYVMADAMLAERENVKP